MHFIPLNSLAILLPGVLSNPVDLEKIWGKQVTKDFNVGQGVSHQMVLKLYLLRMIQEEWNYLTVKSQNTPGPTPRSQT